MKQNHTAPLPEDAPKKKRPSPLIRTLRTIFHMILALISLLLIVGAILLVAYRDELNMDTLLHYLTYSNFGNGDGQMASFIHAGGDELNFCLLDTGAVLSSRAGGHYYSLSGEEYSSAVSNLSIPVLTHSSNTAVVYDGGGQTLTLFSDYQIPFSLTLNVGEELLSARPNDKGWLAVTAQLTGYKGTTTVYNSKYQAVMEINRSSTFLMDAVLSPDCNTVATVAIGQSDGVFQSDLILYPVGDTDPSDTISLGDTVVLDMDYEKDTIWIVGHNALLTVDVSSGDVSTYSYDQYHLKGYTLGGDGFAALLFSEYESGDPNRLVSVGADGQSTGSRSLLGEVPDIDGNGQYVSILSGDGLTIYTSNLSQYALLEDSQGAQALAQSSNGSVLLATAQEAWIFRPDT